MSVLSQRELDDLLQALSSGELEDSVPVKHPNYYKLRTKLKTFWLINGTTIITATTCSFIGALFALFAHNKVRR